MIEMYTENMMKQVPYGVAYLNPSFGAYLQGQDRRKTPNELLSKYAAMVTSGRDCDMIATSLPSGGRVVVHKLKDGFKDLVYRTNISSIDVKGVGLTKSGHKGNAPSLIGPIKEIMKNKHRNDLFGPESMEEAMACVHNTGFLIKLGHITPPPLAVLRPSKMVYEGQLVDPREIISQFHLPKNSEFALLIRGYPSSPARISDFMQWTDELGVSCITPDYFGRRDTSRDLVKVIEKARQLTERYVSKINRGEDWFLKIKKRSLEQLILQLKTYSPCSAWESEGQRCHHTHLQNRTLDGLHVEFTPLTDMSILPKQHKDNHIRELVTAEHEFLQAVASMVLPRDVLNKYLGDVPTLLLELKNMGCDTGIISALESYFNERIGVSKHIYNIKIFARGDLYASLLKEK